MTHSKRHYGIVKGQFAAEVKVSLSSPCIVATKRANESPCFDNFVRLLGTDKSYNCVILGQLFITADEENQSLENDVVQAMPDHYQTRLRSFHRPPSNTLWHCQTSMFC
ncbi:hypothetical protein L596_013139 [Steinernema carpocapsae]|uniref:Uncharacterized protein n=1 Tax=Steinernema carpocapsae TaxID=34508 RepID=A0A4U5P049_STECR|nr:hypothetical protein L596_013139 [Steinernema carpocapsae]